MNKDKFDKPYRVLSTYDEKKAMELFSLIEKSLIKSFDYN